MASPQVCGYGACILQLNPSYTPAQLKSFVHTQAQTGKLNDTGNDNDYTDNTSIMGGNNRYLFMPFNSPYVLQIKNT